MKQTPRTPTFFGLTLPLEVGMSARFRPCCAMLGLFRCRWSVPAPNAEDPRGYQRYGSPCCFRCFRVSRTLRAVAALRFGGWPLLPVDYALPGRPMREQSCGFRAPASGNAGE